ncbi:MAG: sensor histidine kinase [Acidimicrobiales bacterium]|nr:sensor histidine kinase [Acidimicrobiales bacterium]
MDAVATGTRWKRAAAEHPAVVDAAWTTLFLVVAFVSTSGSPTNRDVVEPTSEALGTLLLLGTAVPYFVRRKAPFAVFVLASSAVLVLSGLGYFEGATPIIALFGAFTVGARCTLRWVVGGYVFVVVGLVTLYLSDPPGFDFGGLVANVGTFAAAFLLGWAQQSRAARLEAFEQRTEAVAREQAEEARRALADERLRIAQELHDVVAHSMGVIAVQAGAGMHVIDTDPAEAKRSLEAISSTSRSTLTEIRRLLGVLRDDEGTATARNPAPGLADLSALAADLNDAGVPTQLRIDGHDGPDDDIPKGVELTTYRVVQEALTNVLKHGGPGATARAVVALVPGAVEIDVTDDGRGIDLAADPDAGHGLMGMRERVAVYGGTLDARPQAAGGFRVHARLPFDPEAADDAVALLGPSVDEATR